MQRLIETAARFAACTHPPEHVGELELVEDTQAGRTGGAWCKSCGSFRTSPTTWRAPLWKFAIAVAAGGAIASDEQRVAKLDEATSCASELAVALTELASLVKTGEFEPDALVFGTLADAAAGMAAALRETVRTFEPPALEPCVRGALPEPSHLSQHCGALGDHERCPREPTLGTSACPCHDDTAIHDDPKAAAQ